MSRFEPKVRWWSATSRSLSRFAPARRRHARRRLRLRPPDPGTGRVAGRTSYLLAETGFERSLSERAR